MAFACLASLVTVLIQPEAVCCHTQIQTAKSMTQHSKLALSARLNFIWIRHLNAVRLTLFAELQTKVPAPVFLASKATLFLEILAL
jgi:hypothetical protein